MIVAKGEDNEGTTLFVDFESNEPVHKEGSYVPVHLGAAIINTFSCCLRSLRRSCSAKIVVTGQYDAGATLFVDFESNDE
jgi:hypothetical protein